MDTASDLTTSAPAAAAPVPRFLTCADTARLLRQALGEAFPRVRFSVRSQTYGGGAAINVHYADGPALVKVEAIARVFAGAGFDGMTDYKTVKLHELGGERVYFGADFIFVHRSVSTSFDSTIAAPDVDMLARQQGVSPGVARRLLAAERDHGGSWSGRSKLADSVKLIREA